MPYRLRSGMRGDPGIPSLIRKIGSPLARLAARVIPGGGIVRAGVGLVAGAITGRAAARAIPAILPGGGAISPLAGPRRIARDVRELAASAITGDACPKGHHLNKTGYFTHAEGWIAPRSKCVRIRQRNAANGRALRRAVSRVQSFNSIVKRSRKSLKALASI